MSAPDDNNRGSRGRGEGSVSPDDEPTNVAASPMPASGEPPAPNAPQHAEASQVPPGGAAVPDTPSQSPTAAATATGNPAATDHTHPNAPPPPEAPEKKLSFGQAVAGGVKEAAAPVVGFLDLFGGHLILMARALAQLPRRPFRIKNYLEAGEYIGFGSLPIVLLVGVFTGAVMSLQSVYAFKQFSLESFAGATTGKALALELGPVLTALMLAGRAGSGIATELGTMRITEQIDALESMAVNPVQYLVLPRIVAGALVGPVLALLFFCVGMAGAYFTAVVLLRVDSGAWVSNLKDVVHPIDVVQGMIKSVAFGFLIALIGSYQGFHATGGGRGVGIGTTRAVVIASVTVLISDYFMTDVLLSIFGVTTK